MLSHDAIYSRREKEVISCLQLHFLPYSNSHGCRFEITKNKLHKKKGSSKTNSAKDWINSRLCFRSVKWTRRRRGEGGGWVGRTIKRAKGNNKKEILLFWAFELNGVISFREKERKPTGGPSVRVGTKITERPTT